LGTLLYLIRDY